MKPSLLRPAWFRAALLCLALPASGQGLAPAVPGMDAWRLRHGSGWRAWSNPDDGRTEMIFGGVAPSAIEPASDAEFESLARQRLTEALGLFGTEEKTLVLERVQFLPLGLIGGSDKVTVRFRQALDSIPVEDGFVNVLFDVTGGLLSIQSLALPRLADLDLVPSIDAVRAARIAASAFVRAEGLVPTDPIAPVLVIVKAPPGAALPARLAWRVEVVARVPDAVPVGYGYSIDARTGDVLGRHSTIHEFEVRGTVRARSTPGLAPDSAANPPVATNQRYLTVTSSAGTATTDASGNFSFPAINTPLSVTVTFDGSFNDVENVAGSNYALTVVLPANQDNTITMNPSGQADVTAQANAFQGVNALRDWVRSINPTDNHTEHVARANVNLNSSCNAFYDGGSTNYFIAAGGCANTAYSTVIGHENGHWLNNIYGTGNGPDGMGEGNADVWAMYSYDTPVVGQDFCGGGCGVRSGLNQRPFCGDASPACYGEVHADGEPWMGAAWKIRDRLNTSLGNVQGDLAANSLFLAWMTAYNQGAIKSVIETQWVVLDDVDGDINNGSPHFADIDGAFRAQTFPGLVLHPMTVASATLLPDVPADHGPYGVEIGIVKHEPGQTITSCVLSWRVNGGSSSSVAMIPQSASSYGAALPRVPAPARIEYWITVSDNHAHTLAWPETGPSATRSFRVGAETTLLFETFEAGANGWTHASYGDTANSADDWQFGTPAGKHFTGSQGPIFLEWHDPAAAYSGSQAFGNDLGLATTDGFYGPDEHVRLRSPVIDASGLFGLKLRYRRWLTVWDGAGDHARVRVNGTIVWSNDGLPPILDQSWSQVEIDIASWADNQAALQVEFELQTNGSVQCGGWNVDDVQIVRAGASQPPACSVPTPFGPGKLNSTGEAATLAGFGTPSPNSGFQLSIYGAPPNQLSIVYSSTQPGSTPFLNGTLLIASPYTRDVAWTTSVLGDAAASLPIAPAAVGTTRFYQAVFRDPASPDGSGFGWSRALRIDFCP